MMQSKHDIPEKKEALRNGDTLPRVSENIEICSTTTAENNAPGVDRLQPLPNDMLLAIGKYMHESEVPQLALVSKTMHSIFQPPKVLNKFLQCVAFGKQDRVEQLFRDIYLGHTTKIQEALCYQGEFTDYSGRIFNCTAYEYAYWAKDTHMCRLLEHYMDEETKAQILSRIVTNDQVGLSYQQNGAAYQSDHFDLTPLITALEAYIAGFEALYDARDWASLGAAWLSVGKAQRDVPAHVAQEYCRPDRSFDRCSEFNEVSLPRALTFFKWCVAGQGSWFPLTPFNTGLGAGFALTRGSSPFSHGAVAPPGFGGGCVIGSASLRIDLAAITRLDEVRTAELMQLLEHLNPPPSSPCLLG